MGTKRCGYNVKENGKIIGTASDECPVTCQSCPTLSPSSAPSASPTEFCSDKETQVLIELMIVTNKKPEAINWRLTTKDTDEVVRSVPSGTYKSSNVFEKEYVCLGYDTEYRFKMWIDGTSENGRVSYAASYVDNPSMFIVYNTGNFDRKNTDVFKTTKEPFPPLPTTPKKEP